TLKRYTVFLAIPVYLQDLFAGHHDFVFLSQSYRHFTPLSICSCPEAYLNDGAQGVSGGLSEDSGPLLGQSMVKNWLICSYPAIPMYLYGHRRRRRFAPYAGRLC
ncbi:MAG: hypothetical protein K6G79_02515, partial [Bacteroidales bacterium]|nr:hypothetical protein [Bacteroidales bacterium]